MGTPRRAWSLGRPPTPRMRRYEANLKPVVERAADTLEELERVTRVVRVLEARDDGVSRADQTRKLLLGQARVRPQVVDLLRDRRAQPRGLERRLLVRASFDVSPVQDLEPIGRWSPFSADHGQVSRCVCAAGLASKSRFLRRARSISIGGTADCDLTRP